MKPLLVGIYRGIIILGFLGWCRISSIHSIWITSDILRSIAQWRESPLDHPEAAVGVPPLRGRLPGPAGLGDQGDPWLAFRGPREVSKTQKNGWFALVSLWSPIGSLQNSPPKKKNGLFMLVPFGLPLAFPPKQTAKAPRDSHLAGCGSVKLPPACRGFRRGTMIESRFPNFQASVGSSLRVNIFSLLMKNYSTDAEIGLPKPA